MPRIEGERKTGRTRLGGRNIKCEDREMKHKHGQSLEVQCGDAGEEAGKKDKDPEGLG